MMRWGVEPLETDQLRTVQTFVEAGRNGRRIHGSLTDDFAVDDERHVGLEDLLEVGRRQLVYRCSVDVLQFVAKLCGRDILSVGIDPRPRHERDDTRGCPGDDHDDLR